MSELPAGWATTTLGEIGAYFNGRGFRKSEWSETGRPIIRIQNLTGTSSVFNYYAGEADESYIARNGDVLISWAATLGVYVWRGPEAVVNQHIFKVRSHIDRDFHRYLVTSVLQAMRRETHGSGMVHITRKRFDAIPVLLPPRAEQRRIVAAIEEQLSRVEAGDGVMRACLRRIESLRKRVLISSVPNAPTKGWTQTTIGEAGSVQLGRQRSPKYHHGPHMQPYLRVANVFEDRIDTSDIMQMNFAPEEFERYRLREGDILLNEGQTPDLVGRPAIYRGDPPEVGFTNSLLRFVPKAGIQPEYALLVFLRHLHAGRFKREARITTNIAHLSAGRLKAVEFPYPSEDEQARIVGEVDTHLSLIGSLRTTVEETRKRSAALHRAVLERGFHGELVPQDPKDEPASVLLERIRAERAAAPKPTRRKRVPA